MDTAKYCSWAVSTKAPSCLPLDCSAITKASAGTDACGANGGVKALCNYTVDAATCSKVSLPTFAIPCEYLIYEECTRSIDGAKYCNWDNSSLCSPKSCADIATEAKVVCAAGGNRAS